ncbi:MAG: peroxiredoxin [Rhizobiales bacterium NRL2]|jgi:predicted 2-oxoglutarate/Fe(II)-dependent dioxygenase YbiX/peroxiredoxin|nr:MAG: peroxiredoxin [Rhizobiales bacterium NRL2]
MTGYANLMTGDPAPWFHQRSFANPRYAFDTAAGRYIVLCFFASAGDDHAKAAIAGVRARPDLFDDTMASFFGVSADPADERGRRVAESYPGYRFLWDFDGLIGRLYGALPKEPAADTAPVVRRRWVVLDPTLRVLKVLPFRGDRGDIAELLAFLDGLPPPSRHAGVELMAPVLVLPNVFEPAFCAKLIGLYEEHGGEESGFMRERDGRTVATYDNAHKRRRDHVIEDEAVIQQARARIARRVVPEIRKIHQFEVTRMERYIVACYDAEEGGHFRAHRDNTTRGTAHRRFAVSVNLNDGFEGGEVGFPEYGPRGFRPPAGGALVFSCSLLHRVSTVTRGRRYAFLPFLYDDAAARLREANSRFLEDGQSRYRATPASEPETEGARQA